MKLSKLKQPLLIFLLAGGCLLLAVLDCLVNFINPYQDGLSDVISSSRGLVFGADILQPLLATPLCDPSDPSNVCVGDQVIEINGQPVEDILTKVVRPWPFETGGRQKWVVGQSVSFLILRQGHPFRVKVTLVPFPIGAFIRLQWFYILFFVISLSLATFVFFQRPTDPAAQVLFILTASIIGFETGWFLGVHVYDFVSGPGLWLYLLKTIPLIILCPASVHFVLLLTNYQTLLRKGWFIRLLYGVPLVIFLAGLIISGLSASSAGQWLEWWYGDFSDLLPVVYLGATVGLFGLGYLKADVLTKYRIRPVLMAGGGGVALSLLFAFVPQALFHVKLLDSHLIFIFFLPLPFTIAYAILKRQLFEVEKFVIRALTYLLLIGFSYLFSLALSFLLLLVGRGFLEPVFGRLPAEQLSQFTAFALVVLLIIPLREQVNRLVNRLIYGQGRANPYAILADLDRTAKEHYASEKLLYTITQTVARAFRLPYVAIALRQVADEFEEVAAFGVAHTESLFRTPLIYQAEPIGYLICEGRTPDEKLSSTDQELLQDFASHIAVITNTLRLTKDLEQARQRIALVRASEVRDLRQRMHDVVGPEFAGMAYRLEAVRNIFREDSQAADTLLAELHTDFLNTMPKLRDLSYELLPPQSGLVAALDERVNRSYPRQATGQAKPSIQLINELDPLQSLPPALEMEALQIVLLALANVVRHAGASSCSITLSFETKALPSAPEPELALNLNQHQAVRPTPGGKRFLWVEVLDDGQGLPNDYRPGVGLTSMRERAESVGGQFRLCNRPAGGVQVRVSLPCPV